MASGCWIVLVFSFFFIHFVEIYPVEGVNCPPVRAELGVIRRNAIPKARFLIHLADSRFQLFAIARSAGPASIVLQTTTSVSSKIRWNVAGRDQTSRINIGADTQCRHRPRLNCSV